MEITVKQRRELLTAHNHLKTMLSFAEECHDLHLSDLEKMSHIVHILHKTFNFSPDLDESGNRQYWSDWVFSEDVAEPEDD
jgi:hypothetical protein